MKEEFYMRTSIFALVLLAVAPVVGFAASPTWQTDYTAAQQKAVAQHKPLAVVFGQGANGWQQIAGGSMTVDANEILGDKYVCCYVDTATPAGQALARKFEVNSPVGIVISDRTGNLQAFWHEGALPADALTGYVTRYADPQRAVTATDTNRTSRTSNYPPGAGEAGAAYSPTYQGGGCANGQCGVSSGFRRR